MIGYISLNLKISSIDWNVWNFTGSDYGIDPRTYKGGKGLPPQWGFLIFFLDDKTSARDVFSSCSFIPREHFKTSLVMVS